jgi:hypothetical protein
MDRVRIVAGSHRWLLLAALALLTLALGTAMFSGASFSSKSANSGSLAAGSIQLTSSKANQAVVEGVSAMEPGDSANGTVSIGNQGTVPAKVTLRASGLSGTTFAGVLDLKIEDTTGKTTQVWSGKLNALSSGIELTQFAASETRKYLITLSWPSASNSPSLQGVSTSFSFQWSATATQ